jgi:hypothetical protein
MVDARSEVDFGGFEGVVCREVDSQKENTARVWRVSLYQSQHLPTNPEGQKSSIGFYCITEADK